MLKVDMYKFSGRVGKEPVFKEVGGGLAKMSVAVSRNYKKDNEWVDKTQWVEVEAWGKQAGWLMEKGISKGDTVYCGGAPEISVWGGKDGGEPKFDMVIKLGFDGFVQLVVKKESGGFTADRPAAVVADDDDLGF